MIKRFFSSSDEPPKKRPNLNINIISLMWPGERPENPAQKPQKWQQDLGLLELINAIAHNPRYRTYLYDTLAALNTDITVIEWRQQVLNDFVNNPQLVSEFQALLPQLASLTQNNSLLGKRRLSPLTQTTERLAELEIYVEAIEKIHGVLSRANVQSEALTSLRDSLTILIEDEDFHALRRQLPELRRPLERITSVTIGINLDLQLRPTSAVLLGVNDYQIGGTSSFLDRVIGPPSDESSTTGLTPLNYLPKNPELRPYDPFFQDLEKLMMHVAKPVADELGRYTRISSRPLAHLEFEIAFFLSAVKLINYLDQNNIPYCKPQPRPMDERISYADKLVNINLCFRQPENWIASEAAFGEEGRIAVLTGPNSGGKTTYLQSLGLAQAMFQAGLVIPAREAYISPVDSILTHFPALETRQQGRLAEEAERLRVVFQEVTRHSLVLLNETFSSTSSGEAIYLAQDMLSGFRAIGTRAVFATHLVELVEQLDVIQAGIEGDSDLFSLVAGVALDENGETIRTFEVKRGLPLGRSYAQEIARKHGISLEQIISTHQIRQTSTSTE